MLFDFFFLFDNALFKLFSRNEIHGGLVASLPLHRDVDGQTLHRAANGPPESLYASAEDPTFNRTAKMQAKVEELYRNIYKEEASYRYPDTMKRVERMALVFMVKEKKESDLRKKSVDILGSCTEEQRLSYAKRTMMFTPNLELIPLPETSDRPSMSIVNPLDWKDVRPADPNRDYEELGFVKLSQLWMTPYHNDFSAAQSEYNNLRSLTSCMRRSIDKWSTSISLCIAISQVMLFAIYYLSIIYSLFKQRETC